MPADAVEQDAGPLVARELTRRGWTLAVGESVTGGGLGARLVTVAGASTWFSGGLVAYSVTAKRRLAGVSEDLLAAHSPVSEPVAAALARGARERVGADVGLGVVGVAGPTGQGPAAVGTVCLAVVLPTGMERTATVRLGARGRREVQRGAVEAALEHLVAALAAVASQPQAGAG